MCGIWGILHKGYQEIDRSLVQRMQESIHHRGPDHSGIHIETGMAFGNNRLAIVDLKTGNQPIYNEDHDLVIVYNGELYNHHTIRNKLQKKGHVYKTDSDTETILHAFEEYGEHCVDHFNGMFSFAIWNIKKQTLFLARDPLGIKPLYLYKDHDMLIFASEAKTILIAIKEIRPDWTAISHYFSFGYVPTPYSPFAGISKLRQGHFLWISKNLLLEEKRYFEFEYGSHDLSQSLNVKDELFQHIDCAVQKELMSDVPIGVFLSGGLDSSVVALMTKRHNTQNFHSFSLKFQESTHDESKDAWIVAKHLGLQHHELTLNKQLLKESFIKTYEILDEPFGDSTVVPLYALSKYTSDYVKVVLTGWGGDEIFAGYPTYKAHQMAKFYRQLPSVLGKKIIPWFVWHLPVSEKYMSFEFKAKRFISGMELPSELQHFVWMGYFSEDEKQKLFTPQIRQAITENSFMPIQRQLADIHEKNIGDRILHLDSLFFLEGNGLFQADRMTMAASLEARVPLLNKDLLTYVNQLPYNLKMRKGNPKGLLKSVLASHLPSSIINKPKKGFGPPSSSWVKGFFSEQLKFLFSEEKIKQHGIFNHEYIHALIGEHLNNKCDRGRVLWSLLSFQLWYNKFIIHE